jgi:hypothetical protein
MTRLHRALVLASLLAAPRAFAQPQPQPAPPADPSKMDAKALMTTGVRLLEAKDYLGALALFREAYVRFPSAKILLNIGTTLKLLDRKADAANTYQQYLDSQDADPNRAKQVIGELAELDKSLGVVEVIVRPADAEVNFGDEWIPAARAKQWRVMPGSFKVSARKPGYQNSEQTSTISAGAKTSLSVVLAEVPKQIVEAPREELVATVEPEKPRSRIGALAMLHVSVVPKLGSAALVGATFDVTPRLGIDAAVLLGPGLVSDGMATRPPPSFGGYLGANFAFLPGAFRPRAGAGMTLFSSDGARLQARAAGGLEYVATRNISLTIEVGAEVALNPEDDIRELAIVPAFAVAGRL